MKVRVQIAVATLALSLAACGTNAGANPTPTVMGSSATVAAIATPTPTPAAIIVSDAWARAALSSASGATAAPMGSATPGMGASPAAGATGNSAVYMTIRSASSTADRLVKAASDVAGATELHTAAMVNGVMQMRPVEAIDVPAGGVATLAPGGLHVMLIGLTKDLKVGDTVKLTLTFEKFGTITVTAPVRAA